MSLAGAAVPSHQDAVDSWTSTRPGGGLTRNKQGWLATVRNVRRALSTPGYWRRIGLDAFGAAIKWCEWRGPNAGQWVTWTDEDYTAAREQLELDGFAPVGRELVRDVVARVALDCQFDTAILWLSGLAWDGVPRVAGFLQRYCGALPEAHAGGEAYLQAVSRFLWTALAGRVLSPGCKVDMSPVLVGEGGGQGKTEGVAALAPGAEMACRINLKHADAEIARLLRGVLVAEFAELRGLRGRDSEDIKDFLSARSDKWTQKYREFAHTVARRCVFVGTTDNEAFLSDPVGNFRRWLPVRVGGIDVAGVVEDRLQLWAEGAAMWRGEVAGAEPGVAWRAAQALARREHGDFVAPDSWAEVIRAWMEGSVEEHVSSGAAPTSWGEMGFTVRQALVMAVGKSTQTITRGDEMRAAETLKMLGLERGRGSTTRGMGDARVWRQPRLAVPPT